jgi:hypothetical protein
MQGNRYALRIVASLFSISALSENQLDIFYPLELGGLRKRKRAFPSDMLLGNNLALIGRYHACDRSKSH